jgi:phosphoribosylglycinamide formyltransferase-1
MNTTNIAIFISGKGSNALNLIAYFKNSEQFKICLIFATKENPELERSCAINNIEFHFSVKNGIELEKDQVQLCTSKSISWVVLAGYLKQISPSFIALFPNRIINIHPSLLPKFGGKGMYGINVHRAVLAGKESKSGITIHYVTEEFDKGEIIAQYNLDIEDDETLETLETKIHELELHYFPMVLEEIFKKEPSKTKN